MPEQMERVDPTILEQVIAGTAEPVLVVRIDQSEWPVAIGNPAFATISGEDPVGKPFADVIEALLGRDLAVEISEAVRARQETSFPVEQGGREYLLALKPISMPDEAAAAYCAAFWRGAAATSNAISSDAQHALLRAKRQIRDLSREDPATGLLNERAFREVLHHDWAVAAREKSTLAVVVFSLDHFDAYVDVFGEHAADTCLRRVGQAIRRCLRRASDVVARLGGHQLAVLSHASGEDGVQDFAGQISTAVRELGLHHPRSKSGKFVTVSYRIDVVRGEGKRGSAAKFLEKLLVDVAG
jgi:diguanylate cyclase (GGDEF)-like protein